MALFHYFHPLKKLDRERAKTVDSRLIPGFIKQNLLENYPDLHEDACRQEYICLDLETTGLDPMEDKILSLGWVTIRDQKIDMSSCVELMINEDADIRAKTAVINHITPEMLMKGITLDEAMMAFFSQSVGKVIVAHGCVIERNFFNRYLSNRYQLKPVPLLWLDTLGLEKHLSKLSDRSMELDLRLSSTRYRYGLPEYNAHGALIDSVATAELLLAQLKRIYRNQKSCFGRLYRISRSQ
ncbi:3'-5' exonuclease [Vibrio sp. DW001]|uniref:3'-5' exonuclease n=1 Tax=Vibrio sp. DW001 TaxID=2912315 RepID=UPI0023B1B167|nr:3'-5' exonuclease [Vibrio sp. DW001]WED29388.1 3'-5' exonuclease [Vibrio sp. DW001]